MAIKKPTRRVMPVGEASMTLMGNQDTRNKGDSTSRKKGECITFWVTEEQKQEMSTYAAEHNTTVSRIIIEALRYAWVKGNHYGLASAIAATRCGPIDLRNGVTRYLD